MLSGRTRAFVALACAASALGASIQDPSVVLPADAAQRRQDVKDIFMTSWNAYKQFAFPHDDLAPISRGFVDGRNGWGATAVDAMSTLWIMDEREIFNEMANFTATVDFTRSKTSGTVSVFETTIRHLGGILSAYELGGANDDALLKQAEVIGQKLSHAWVNGNKIPYSQLDFTSETPTQGPASIAAAGTLTLEWSRLAKYTGNDTYRALAEDSVRHIAASETVLPGFPAQRFDPATGKPVSRYVTWGGSSDSYIEYLIKYARLTNTDDNLFADNWATAVDSSIKTLLRTSTVGNHVYFADREENGRIRHVGSNLACFHAGNLMMGGRLMNNQTIFDLALQLNEGCWNTYASTATGIGPEAFAFFSDGPDGNYTGSTPDADDLAFYAEHGFFPRPGAEYYYMRPEVLESNFYAWRATGGAKYYDRAVAAVQSFNAHLRIESDPPVYAPIWDVNTLDSDFIDDMESFWFAEVLKYLYLTFDDPGRFSLDEYVFNTEAHPFIAPPAKEAYGSGRLLPELPVPSSATNSSSPAVSSAPEDVAAKVVPGSGSKHVRA